MIKHYKGIDDLFTSYESLLADYKNIHLVIAGKCEDENLYKLLALNKNKYSKYITLYLHHIEDNNVQYFYNASDIVVLPFKSNTTSGSAILSITFGKPLIAPLIGSIINLPNNTGIYYNKNKKDGLRIAMNAAIKNKSLVDLYSQNAYNYSLMLSWNKSSIKMLKIYQSLGV